jgi:hypothetical protein
MCDKLVFDLAQEVEGQPSVFIRKDWINCLDNQNQNYNGNQSILDTSQLSNSNKYMSYRESYFSIPFLLTLGSIGQPQIFPTTPAQVPTVDNYFEPNNATTSADYALGLKSWFGQIIHSFTLDYNGTTIIQQTPFVNMWNSFRLITSLSLDDINTQGPTIGFYPDDATSWGFELGNSTNGSGTCNNKNNLIPSTISGIFNNYNNGTGNIGFKTRQQYINFDVDGGIGTNQTYGNLLQGGIGACQQVWKSYILTKINQTAGQAGVFQISIVATVYLKHVHSFFNMIPLLKGVFMKMTMNLNNTSFSFNTAISVNTASAAGPPIVNATNSKLALYCTGVANPLGGVNPVMLASGSDRSVVNQDPVGFPSFATNVLQYTVSNGAGGLFLTGDTYAGNIIQSYRVNLSVGSVCLDQQLSAIGGNVAIGQTSKSIYLYIPAYTFNPVFEQAYLSSPVKTIKYTDVYQYQVINIANNGTFNNLITNGIANVKSVLLLPFYSANAGGAQTAVGVNGVTVNVSNNTGFNAGLPVWQSPFDPAGTGTTSPLCWLSNFNIQVSGQNAIYNTERYNFEQFNNQLYGQNAVNGGLTDGLTSALINRQAFDMCYNYYYVNVERMLPAEQQVPKSIQILGQNFSSKDIDIYVFVEFGVEVKIDCLTGARV